MFHERIEEHAKLVFGPAEGGHQTVAIDQDGLGFVFRRNHSCHQLAADRTHEAAHFTRPEESSIGRIGNQHLAGAKTLPFDNFLIGKIGDAHFRAHDEQSVGG